MIDVNGLFSRHDFTEFTQTNVFATIAEKLVDVWKPWIADLNFSLEIDGFQGSFGVKSMTESLSSPSDLDNLEQHFIISKFESKIKPSAFKIQPG